MSPIVDAAGIALASIGLAHGAAWSALSALALRLPAPPRAATGGYRFAVIVPAHNEEASVAATVRSILADAYDPAPTVVVVADNCTDATADAASAAGATVIERRDETRRGKSFALDFAIAHLEQAGDPPSVYVVVDADTTVEPGFFAALAGSFERGASVVQGRYEVAPSESTVARLRALAFTLVHYSRPLGASRLGLGIGLKGNGMAFRREAVANGIPGAGIAEDASATVALASLGIGVAFEPNAVVRGAMAAGYAEASVQDRRWEGGRLSLAPRAFAAGLRALSKGQVRAAGSSFDVAALPLTLAGASAGLSLVLAFAGVGSLPLAIAAAASLVAYPVLGWAAARVPPRELAVLSHAPRFIVHKLRTLGSIALRGAPRSWERTQRETHP